MVKFARKYGFLLILCLLSSSAWSDTLELRNGSVIKGKFISRTDTDISFQVGSSVQKYRKKGLVDAAATISLQPFAISTGLRGLPGSFTSKL